MLCDGSTQGHIKLDTITFQDIGLECEQSKQHSKASKTSLPVYSYQELSFKFKGLKEVTKIPLKQVWLGMPIRVSGSQSKWHMTSSIINISSESIMH